MSRDAARSCPARNGVHAQTTATLTGHTSECMTKTAASHPRPITACAHRNGSACALCNVRATCCCCCFACSLMHTLPSLHLPAALHAAVSLTGRTPAGQIRQPAVQRQHHRAAAAAGGAHTQCCCCSAAAPPAIAAAAAGELFARLLPG